MCGGSWPSPQAFRQATPLSPLQLLATSSTPFSLSLSLSPFSLPLSLSLSPSLRHTHKYVEHDRLVSRRSQQMALNLHMWSLSMDNLNTMYFTFVHSAWLNTFCYSLHVDEFL